MVGDFMVCVDRIIASAGCFDPSSDAGGGAAAPGDGGVTVERCGNESKKGGGKMKKKLKGCEAIECRICQEEGEEGDMEAPCACKGTLKFAHRKCVQKWCNKKGNITCEICNQVFSPNYSLPPSRPNSNVIVDIRQSWDTRIDLHDSRFLAIAAAEQDLLGVEYAEYASANNSGIACCRSVVLILMLLLFVHHILLAMREVGMAHDISALFNVSLQFIGVFLPCYLIARSCYLTQWRHRRQIEFTTRVASLLFSSFAYSFKRFMLHHFADLEVYGKKI